MSGQTKRSERIGVGMGMPQINITAVGLSLGLSCALLATTGCVFKETYDAEKSRSLNFQRLLAQEEKRTAELDNELKRIKRDATDYETRNRELSAQVQSAREQMGRLQEEADALRDAMMLQQKAMEQSKAPAPAAAKKKSALPAPSKLDLRSMNRDTAAGASAGTGGDLSGGLSGGMAGSMAGGQGSDMAGDTTLIPGGSLPESTPTEILPSASALSAASAKADKAAQSALADGRSAIRHQVKPGDTVYRLSKRYGTTVEKIRTWNNRKDDLLEVGEKIIVGFE